MTDEITKSELQMMIEVQSKAATQMEKVACSLNIIVENHKTIMECLSGCTVCKENIKNMNKDIVFIKWTIGSVVAVVGIGMIILELLEKFH